MPRATACLRNVSNFRVTCVHPRRQYKHNTIHTQPQGLANSSLVLETKPQVCGAHGSPLSKTGHLVTWLNPGWPRVTESKKVAVRKMCLQSSLKQQKKAIGTGCSCNKISNLQIHSNLNFMILFSCKRFKNKKKRLLSFKAPQRQVSLVSTG